MSEYLLTHGSYVAILVVLLLSGSGLPLPEEVPIIAAGILSAHGVLDWWLAGPLCLVGAVGGDCLLYFFGYHFGRNVLKQRRWFARHVTPEREQQIEEMFRRHGLKVFFLARFVVVLRSPLMLAAGILRLSFKRFLAIDLLCGVIVVGAVFGLSYFFGQAVERWLHHTEFLVTVMVLLAIVGAGFYFYFWRRTRRNSVAKQPPPDENPPRKPDKTDSHAPRLRQVV